MRTLKMCLIAWFLTLGTAFSQRDGMTTDLLQSVRTKIKDRLGLLYRLQSVVHVDSAIGNRAVADGNITDPYGTLSQCVLFLARGRDSSESAARGFVGVFKNNDIVWISDGVIDGEGISGASISRTLDLNRDGNVEIVTSWFWGMHDPLEYLWILRWDGNQGTFINHHVEGQSVVVSQGHLFQFLDVDGDGILEIKGDMRDVRQGDENAPTYRWNGEAYFPIAGPLPDSVPRDRMDIKLTAKVIPAGDYYSYRYSVRNGQNSLQQVDDFCLSPAYGRNLISMGGRPGWRPSSSDRHIRWTNSLGTLGDPNFIKPGEADSSFSVAAVSPPAISGYYLQGHNGEVFSGEQILTNSVHGITLAPAGPIIPFDPRRVIDTVESYKHRALSLGWIRSQGIANSLDQKLSDARLQLQKGNAKSAQNILRAFVNEVEGLNKKGDQISDEAYALLKFNVEYLIGKLEE